MLEHSPTTRPVRPILAAGLLLAALAYPAGADAQGLGDRLRRKAAEAAARKVEERTERTAGEATDAALDEATARAKAAAKGTTKPGAQQADSGASRRADAEAKGGEAKAAPVEAAPAGASATPAPRTVNAGRDFTPGTRVLYDTDFAGDEIGDFPRAFKLRGGNAEVAEVGGTRYLRATSFGGFDVPLPETLPERFTMEFDFTGAGGWHQRIYFGGTDQGELHHVRLRPSDGGIVGPDQYDVTSEVPDGKPGVPFRVQIMADGDYVKVYMNGRRVANAPNAAIGRASFVRFVVSADDEAPVLLGNLRIAAGGKDLYAALSASGRVTADGILFDTNSDRIRAESAPVLKEIADMLAAHPALRIAIEGHTDDVGGAAANQTLSDRRAAAVKRHLVSTLGVDAARLESAGYGATRPVVPNDSDANRQKNRRVELVKR